MKPSDDDGAIGFERYIELTRAAAAAGDPYAQLELDRWERWGLLDRHPSRGEEQ